MSGDDHGHGSGHGHGDDAPNDIIPPGSLQDNILGVVSASALVGLVWFMMFFTAPEGIKVLAPAHHGGAEHGAEVEHAGAAGGEHGAAAAEHGTGGAEHEAPATETAAPSGESGTSNPSTTETTTGGAGEAAPATGTDSSAGTATTTGATERPAHHLLDSH
jgi:hypothetical protein